MQRTKPLEFMKHLVDVRESFEEKNPMVYKKEGVRYMTKEGISAVQEAIDALLT